MHDEIYVSSTVKISSCMMRYKYMERLFTLYLKLLRFFYIQMTLVQLVRKIVRFSTVRRGTVNRNRVAPHTPTQNPCNLITRVQ